MEQWLTELTAGEAKAIVWTGGPCELVQPGTIDAGSDWCAQASITLKHPRSPQDRPMVEIYFDTPTHGRPSPAYAFRGMIDDEGLVRFRGDFEGAWLERFATLIPQGADILDIGCGAGEPIGRWLSAFFGFPVALTREAKGGFPDDRAAPGERFGDRESDPRRRTGNQCALSVQL